MKNTLVCYEGGGFDGCIWQENYAVFDAQGVLRDVASSGCMGLFSNSSCKCLPPEEQCEQAAAELKERMDANERGIEFFDLTDDADLDRFQRSFSVNHVLHVVQRVNDILGSKIMYWRCTTCKCKFNTEEDAFLEGWHGIGGIASQAEELLCSDCYSAGTCMDCSGYYGTHDLKRGLCEYCIEKRLKASPEVAEDLEGLEDAVVNNTRVINEYCQQVPLAADKARAWFADFMSGVEARRAQLMSEVTA